MEKDSMQARVLENKGLVSFQIKLFAWEKITGKQFCLHYTYLLGLYISQGFPHYIFFCYTEGRSKSVVHTFVKMKTALLSCWWLKCRNKTVKILWIIFWFIWLCAMFVLVKIYVDKSRDRKTVRQSNIGDNKALAHSTIMPGFQGFSSKSEGMNDLLPFLASPGYICLKFLVKYAHHAVWVNNCSSCS